MPRKSIMSHAFSMIPSIRGPRSTFDRSHGMKTAFNAGKVIPILVDEVLPGDTFSMRHHMFGRLATPIVPILDNIFMDFHYFFVPNRILWDNWVKLCGEKTNPADPHYDTYEVPVIDSPAGGFTEESIFDYMGIPTKVHPIEINALHLRAYNRIWTDWYRHQDLSDSASNPTGDGPDNQNLFVLSDRFKRHDYFTSCLPEPQKGPGVELPIGTSAPVYGTGNSLGIGYMDNASNPQTAGLSRISGPAVEIMTDAYNTAIGTTVSNQPANPTNDESIGVVESPLDSGLYADLSSATAASINSLRVAMQIQILLERDARGGTRYKEVVKSHFNVDSADQRLDRPEFLGGSTTRININPVQQTSSTDGTSPQGNLAGFGIISDSKGAWSKSFSEHGVIIGLASVRADLTYQQGLDRMWSRKTRHDFYWPSFAHLGEQAVLTKEIYMDGTVVDEVVFGYQERYAEYRYKPSKITGRLRSNAVAPLDKWHLSQNFGGAPVLNYNFMKDDTSTILKARTLAVPSEPDIILDGYFQLKCARPMPVYGVPGQVAGL